MASDLLHGPRTGEPVAKRPVGPPRLRIAIGIVVIFWTVPLILRLFEIGMFARFLVMSGVYLLAALTFLIWWMFNRRIPRSERWVILSVLVGGGIVSKFLLDPSVIVPSWLLMAFPLLFTAWTLWLLITRITGPGPRRFGLTLIILTIWGAFLLIRMEGLDGEGEFSLYWRWSPTEEAKSLAEIAKRPPPGPAEEYKLEIQKGDWPGFRGPKRDGAVHGVTITTDWKTSEPKKLWGIRVCPGWSSVALVGDHLYTQEQRDQSEAVVCFNALTGKEIWVHEDNVRFYESQAGAGPRATPTFADGYIYTFGGSGLLNCLEASTGKKIWMRDVVADSGCEVPMWGFSSSPVVAQGKVVIYAGGQTSGKLLAYNVDTGEPYWTADAGKMGYGSVQFAVIGGHVQFLFLGDRGLTAYEPATGAVLWEHKLPGGAPGLPRSLQPQVLGDSQILIAGEDFGTALLEVKRDGEAWKVDQRWTSTRMKPSFNDFVVYDGSIYGYDGGIFCCLDLQTGAQRWKDGRYGKGQVILLADQGLLLVISEDGKAVLLKATPERHTEIGKFQAIDGKKKPCWNHPVVVHGRLYVRNGAEMACYDLGGEKK